MKMFVETNAGAGVLVGVGSPANSPQAKITGKTSTNTNNCQTELNDPSTMPVAPMFGIPSSCGDSLHPLTAIKGSRQPAIAQLAGGPRLRILAFLPNVTQPAAASRQLFYEAADSSAGDGCLGRHHYPREFAVLPFERDRQRSWAGSASPYLR